MAGAWMSERPRQLAVPAPYGSSSARPSSSKGPDTIRALREKLSEFKNENSLLGSLVKDLKTERDGLSNKLAATTKQLAESNGKAACASLEAQNVNKGQRRLQAEVERLSSVVHSHSVRLQKSKQQQQELEDVALDLRQELEDTKQQLAQAQQAAQAAQQRNAAAEAKMMAAGLGPLPKMGPTAEQLVINSTQRIKELTEELAAAKADAQQQHETSQQQLQQCEARWQQQLAAAQTSAQQAQQTAEQQRQQQEAQLQRQAGQLAASEQQVKQLQELLVGAQARAADGQALAQAKQELQHLKQDMLCQSQALQQQVVSLQGQLAEAQLQHAAATSQLLQQLTQAERQAAAAQREKQELTAALVALRQQESGRRLAAGEAAAKAERVRGELVKCVGELQVQLDAAAAAGQQQAQQLSRLRALEAAAGGAREEAGEARRQLVELATVSMRELREQVANEAAAITGLPEGTAADLPAPVSTYIKVLEHAVCDCEERCKQLLQEALTAQQQEREARTELAVAREQQAAAQRALQQQTQRLLAAERMRLADLQQQASAAVLVVLMAVA
ncbi:hypothetical protein OEZ85_013363 [Tetradesmus obliquus]|uniref:Uncharacterized protein n=1 Tax=Tetradesmus obliquus TaxID=3088 RepID=A0ABY8U5I1_TETOB|nr:hypothetical protein OEZ85_013363 [Tetradesmus obliquus]